MGSQQDEGLLLQPVLIHLVRKLTILTGGYGSQFEYKLEE